MPELNGAVLVGSGAFTSALLAPLMTRYGAGLRVNPDPDEALRHGKERGGLFVVEYQTDRWLAVFQELRSRLGEAVRIVVALPAAKAHVLAQLRPLVDVAYPAEKGAAPALDAVGRIAAGQPVGTPFMQVPGGPELQVASAPVRPSTTPVPGTVALPRAAPPAPVAARNGAMPAPMRYTPPPTAAPAGRPTLTPVPYAPTPAPNAGLVPVSPLPPADTLADPIDPLDAVFDDIEEEAIRLDDPFAAQNAPGAPAHAAASETWPGALPDDDTAEQLLAAAVAGLAPAEDATLAAYVEAMTTIERAALGGEPLEADGDVIRRAAALRYRVAVALATLPPTGTAVDAAAAGALLADLDATLGALKEAGAAAPSLSVPLDQLRRAVVKEAVDLSEAIHRIAPMEAPGLARAPAPAAQARVLSVSAADTPGAEARRAWKIWVALALSVVIAVSFHGYRWWSAHNAQRPPPVAGVPAGLIAVKAGNGGFILTPDGIGTVDRAEYERFRTDLELKGMMVKEKNGVVLVVPRPASTAAGATR